MIDIFEAVALFFPIKIEQVSWDGDTLILSTADWSFRTESVWRVSKNHKLQFACWDDDAPVLISDFLGASIIEIKWITDAQPIDPSIKLSDGRVLDVFCSISIEPWVMELSSGAVYLGNC
jgi:hypothetical protein